MPIIINGGSRRAGGWWAKHLGDEEKNERVEVIEFVGLTAETMAEAFREMYAVSRATNCENYFYQANINPRADERLTPAQWREAVDTLEKNLGLTGQPRFVVEHEKEGRTHRHVVWCRIDAERMVAISDSLTAAIHERTSRELEIKFDLERGRSILTPDRDFERPERRPKKHETFRAAETGIDPQTVKAELDALRRSADSGRSFKAALEASGYALARGDRRDFVVIDRAGDDHSLARRLGIKAAEVRDLMKDVDRASLPSVAEARAMQKARAAERAAEAAAQPERRYDPLHAAHQAVQFPQQEGRYDALRDAAPPPEIVRAFEAAAARATEPPAPNYDRDRAEAAWMDAVAAAAIAKDEATRAPQDARQQHMAAGEGVVGPAEPTLHAGGPQNAGEGYSDAAEPTQRAEPVAENAIGTPAAAVEQGIHSAGRIAGALAKTVENILSGLFSFFGAAEPKLTPDQAKRAEMAAAERADARAADLAHQQQEAAAYDWRMEMLKNRSQEKDLRLAQTLGTAANPEANRGRDEYDQTRERQLERER